MSMERVEVDPAALRELATNHDHAAEKYEAARDDSSTAVNDANSWGPLFYEARRATEEAAEARDTSLSSNAQRERNVADQLRRGGAAFGVMNEQNTTNLRNIAE
ncbi:type VII secretion target [Mycobacteroides abscessus subsp. abscessus]|uniref:type VII secretion target n=3 Tax=Mycobacteroides abscessus TaxID=36809 RepID=UPI0002FF08F9|nr:type VII secretion target [Mycobacteroides abscessus]MDO3101056.1 type VII secretion target [Mycobacteroides abscessus subsp. abscessus]MDO3185019.1 type VII secretion target [Mycobacteroides abscessus subsp. abscessus]MDO3194358.1 type VII secretion target [Mycobacteroides abscessus subsp. abscessus]MDO3287447.1 type VII secretion target [Mycobacteroides abscessus subsp. abscessus]SHR22989.1 Protein of uncharacterised function (DUF2580) [Mycobacteroides abscessus subsp. abscessus]